MYLHNLWIAMKTNEIFGPNGRLREYYTNAGVGYRRYKPFLREHRLLFCANSTHLIIITATLRGYGKMGGNEAFRRKSRLRLGD